MAKVLVTGGAGFIGSHLVDALVKKHQVTIIDNLSTGQKKYINKKAKFIKVDIRSKKILDIFKKGKFDYVFHLAAQKNLQYSKTHPVEDADINILGSLNIVNAAVQTKVKKIIFYSTAAVYDAKAKPPNKETDAPNPSTPYGVAKRVVEKYLEISTLQYTILRLANVYGPRQDKAGEGGVIAIFCEHIAKNTRPSIYNSGNQTRDFIYVDDVVRASIKSLQVNKNTSINISTNKEVSVKTVFKEILSISKKNITFKKGITIQEQQRSALANTRAKKELNWKREIDLKDGLLLTYNWFKEKNDKKNK